MYKSVCQISQYLLTESVREIQVKTHQMYSSSTNTSHKNSLTKFCSLCSLYLIGVIKV